MEKYENRHHAGQVLAGQLEAYQSREDVIILALPRGGVPVAFEVAKTLHLPLDVFVVRKLGVPGQNELAMGALAIGGALVFNDDIIKSLQVSPPEIQQSIAMETVELKRRELLYRGERPFPVLENKTLILVDDGIATGATMRAAIQALRLFNPAEIVVAIPVADQRMIAVLQQIADEVICPLQPTNLHAVGSWYQDFSQTTDQEVYNLLETARTFAY